MLYDISCAKKTIYLETFRFENDHIGIKFKNYLAKRAREGVRIMLMMDDWGTSVNKKFFKELIEVSGHVLFFKKLRLSYNFFLTNHERNHRKLLIIDEQIVYISSNNITNYNLNWREISLRLEGRISLIFSFTFMRNWNLKNTYKFKKASHIQIIKDGNFEIIRDVPSVRYQKMREKLIHMIKQSGNGIILETPYFLPTYRLMDALIKAARRGVKITLILPKHSDVRTADILRNHYLGRLHLTGINIQYYLPSNLHSKLALIDDQFYIGSSNLDYRSFRYMFEIGLFGDESDLWNKLKQHTLETLSECESFNYDEWSKRGKTTKLLERLLLPFKHFF